MRHQQAMYSYITAPDTYRFLYPFYISVIRLHFYFREESAVENVGDENDGYNDNEHNGADGGYDVGCNGL